MTAVVVLGALEHQVLEKVGEAGASNLFVLGAHVIPDVDCHQGYGMVLMKNDIEAVG